jgi:hypothetical protein
LSGLFNQEKGYKKKGGEILSETIFAYLFMVFLMIVGGIVVYVTAKRAGKTDSEITTEKRR